MEHGELQLAAGSGQRAAVASRQLPAASLCHYALLSFMVRDGIRDWEMRNVSLGIWDWA